MSTLQDPHGAGYGKDDLSMGAGLADGIVPLPANEICKLPLSVSDREKDRFCVDACKQKNMGYNHVFEDGCSDMTRKFTCMCAK